MSKTLQQQIISQFCRLGEANAGGCRVGVQWHEALVKLTILTLGYTHEGVSCVEALDSHALYNPDFDSSASQAIDALLALKALTGTSGDDASDGDFLYLAKRRLVRILNHLSYQGVAEMVKETQSSGTRAERVPKRIVTPIK